MRKYLLAVAMLICVHTAFSQDYSALEKKIAKSDKELEDIKKKDNPKTWLTRAAIYQEIIDAPTKGIWAGMSSMEYKLMSSQLGAATGETQATIGGTSYAVTEFPDKKVYLDDKGVVFWEVKRYAVAKPFEKAFESYTKAIALDTDQKNTKKIAEGLDRLSAQAKTQGFNEYQLEQYQKAFDCFNLSLECSSHPVVNKVDSVIVYYSGVMAAVNKDTVNAVKYFSKAVAIGYDQKGEAYARLAEVQPKGESLTTLTKGFEKYPESNEIMIGLINAYMTEGKNPAEIVPLLRKAQAMQPTNASLHFAEGQLYEKINDYDKAASAYSKSTEVDPAYFYGYYGLGIMYFNRGVAISEEANALDVSKTAEFDRMNKLADDQFLLALPQFEKAHALNKEEKGCVQALKDIYFRFRNKGDEQKKKSEEFKLLYDSMNQ